MQALRIKEGESMNQILSISGLPVMARLRRTDSWEVTMRKVGKDLIFSANRSTPGELEEITQSVVRDHFMAVDSPDSALAFFKQHGPFQRQEGATDLSPTERALDVSFATLERHKDLWRSFISDPVPECFQSPATQVTGMDLFAQVDRLLYVTRRSPEFTVELGHVRISGDDKAPSPFLRQVANCVEDAIFNSIYIDKMAGLRGTVCERCGVAFLSDSDKPKRFCTPICANAARQKRLRDSRRIAAVTTA